MREDADWNNIEEIVEGGGSGKRMPAGNYVCRVTEARDFPDKEYVRLLVDVAEGEYAGHFSDSWYDDKDWAHNVFLSYKEGKALSYTKGRLHIISDCNPGFDAFAAWGGGVQALPLFVGKLVGVTFNEEEYTADDGSTKCGLKTGALCDVKAVRDGSAPAARHKYIDGNWCSLEEAHEAEEARKSLAAFGAGVASAADNYADIPFK